jgi:cysteine desulfurase/selenocysteine lyase
MHNTPMPPTSLRAPQPGQRPPAGSKLPTGSKLPAGAKPAAGAWDARQSDDRPQPEDAQRPFPVQALRKDFPGLHQSIHGKPLVYLDNAATTQRPQAVIDAWTHASSFLGANIHRGVHALSYRATEAFEASRVAVQGFMNAASPREVIFTRGTTEGINLVAQTFGRAQVGPGDEVLITTSEHHSNIVPWQMLCAQVGAHLKVIPLLHSGELDMDNVAERLTPRTRLLSISHVSNALGTINPIEKLIALAKARGIAVLVDGAQAVPHLPVDVQRLGCDFYVWSSHKLFGPTGVGVLWGREALLEAMPPYQGGGDMIASVTFEKTTYNELPHKFEAGTPDINGVIALRAALQYVAAVGYPAMQAYEDDLLRYATRALRNVDGLTIVGTAARKAGVISFTLDDVHPHDIGTVLDKQSIAIRTGHHCAQPVMAFYNIAATARASLAFYNTREEVDALALGLRRIREMFV